MNSKLRLGGVILLMSMVCSTAFAAYPIKAVKYPASDDYSEYMAGEVYPGWKASLSTSFKASGKAKAKTAQACFEICLENFTVTKPKCDNFLYDKKTQVCSLYVGAWVPKPTTKCLTWTKNAAFSTGRLYADDDVDTQTTLSSLSCEATR